jgi:hypothetical protein
MAANRRTLPSPLVNFKAAPGNEHRRAYSRSLAVSHLVATIARLNCARSPGLAGDYLAGSKAGRPPQTMRYGAATLFEALVRRDAVTANQVTSLLKLRDEILSFVERDSLSGDKRKLTELPYAKLTAAPARLDVKRLMRS